VRKLREALFASDRAYNRGCRVFSEFCTVATFVAFQHLPGVNFSLSNNTVQTSKSTEKHGNSHHCDNLYGYEKYESKWIVLGTLKQGTQTNNYYYINYSV